MWNELLEKTASRILFMTGLMLFIMNSATRADQIDGHQPEKPNIIFVLADDLGWTDVNIFDPLERTYYETPNLDRLAGEGMIFTQAYSNAANSAPTRAALISGQYYPHQPIYHAGSPGQGELIPAPNAHSLPLEKVTIAEALKQGGYRTGFIGKWHIGKPPESGPQEQGFEINIGGNNAGNPGGWEGGYFEPNNNPFIDDARPGEYLTDYLTRKAQEYIRAHRSEPFYLQLSYFTPHSPHQAPREIVERYKQKKGMGGHNNPHYAAMIDVLDRNIGRLMQTIREAGIEKNTLFIFFSDNGGVGGYGFLGHSRNNVTDLSPLKGGKTTYYEGGIRVPMIIRWPRIIEPGSNCNEPVIGTDFYPTLLAAAGIQKPRNYLLDGKNLMPLLKGEPSTDGPRDLYWHFPGYPNNIWRTSPVSALRYGKWKLIKFYEAFYRSGEVELYDLQKDIAEKHNVAKKYPAIARDLQNKLEIWLEKNNAPTPMERRSSSGNTNFK